MSAKMATVSGNLKFKRSQYGEKDDDKELLLHQNIYSHVVQLIIPENVTEAADVIKGMAKDQPYYCVKDLAMISLLTPQFIQAFVKRGSLHILSHGTKIDTSSCMALLPSGKLILHVTKDDYEVLGIEGTPSKLGNIKYMIEIDLLSPNFVPGTKLYERIFGCLSRNIHLSWTCLVAWDSHDEAISPISLKAYFEDCGHQVISCELEVEEESLKNLKTPQISYDQSSEENCRHFWEWMGTTSCGIRWGRDVDDWVSNIGSDQPSTTLSHCKFINVTGFITSRTMQKIHNVLRKLTSAEDLDWSSLIIHGFQDSPVSLFMCEHGFDMSGDNISAFVNFKNDNYWHLSVCGNWNGVI